MNRVRASGWQLGSVVMTINFLLHKTNKCFVCVQYVDGNLTFILLLLSCKFRVGKKIISKYYALLNSFFSFAY
jgi:hypothetical protein